MAKLDEDDEPVDCDRYKAALPWEGFVRFEQILANLAKKRWSKKRVQRVHDELVAAGELIIAADGSVGLNNAVNRNASK